MWKHNCPVDGEIEVGDNEPCNWCNAIELQNLEDKEILIPTLTNSIAALESKYP